jgi:hypothetical protein
MACAYGYIRLRNFTFKRIIFLQEGVEFYRVVEFSLEKPTTLKIETHLVVVNNGKRIYFNKNHIDWIGVERWFINDGFTEELVEDILTFYMDFDLISWYCPIQSLDKKVKFSVEEPCYLDMTKNSVWKNAVEERALEEKQRLEKEKVSEFEKESFAKRSIYSFWKENIKERAFAKNGKIYCYAPQDKLGVTNKKKKEKEKEKEME